MNEDSMNNIKNSKRRDKHPFWIWESIMDTPKKLGECLSEPVSDQVRLVAEKCKNKKINKVFLLGTGSSYFAAIAEKFAFEQFSEVTASHYLTSEFREYIPKKFDNQSAVFFHSHSGGTKGDPETVQKVRDLGGYTVGITDIRESALDKSVDDSIIGPGGAKVELPATRTYATAIFRMLQLAIELGKGTPFHDKAMHGLDQLIKIPDVLETVAQKYAEASPGIVETLKECSSFFVIGSGPNYATADEAALGISQSSGIPSQAFHLENFLHGPIQTLRPNMGIVLIAAPGPFQERYFNTARACKAIGAKVVLMLPENTQSELDYDIKMEFPAGIPEVFTPLIYMTPLWQIAYYFSLYGRGCHTDRLAMDRPEFIKAFSMLMQGDKKFVT